MPSDNLQIHYQRYTLDGGWSTVDARVIGETTVGLSVNGEDWLSFLCTPFAIEELATGFLYNEGVIDDIAEIADIQVCADGTHVDAWLTHTAARPLRWSRTSGCGGGATRPEAPRPLITDQKNKKTIAPEQLLANMDLLLDAQDLYRETGGIHCSAISDGERLVYRAEDIGRHNTFDKLAGQALRDALPDSPRVILTTGRISSEMIQKAARMGAETVVSRTSPTSASVQIAQEIGITLCGYARHSHFNVYTHSERLKLI